MDPIQTLLIIVIIALSTLLVIVGVESFLLLKNLRKLITNLNAKVENSIKKGLPIDSDAIKSIIALFKRKHG